MYASKEIKRYDFICRIEKQKLLIGEKYEENQEDKYDHPNFIKLPALKHPDANCLAFKLTTHIKSEIIEYFLIKEVQYFKKKFRFVGEDLIGKVTTEYKDQLVFQENYGRA